MTENSNLLTAIYDEVPVEKIQVPEGRRRLDESKVIAFVESIADLGLLQPVGLTSDHRLIYGLRTPCGRVGKLNWRRNTRCTSLPRGWATPPRSR